jgi:hypothetical protein
MSYFSWGNSALPPYQGDEEAIGIFYFRFIMMMVFLYMRESEIFLVGEG